MRQRDWTAIARIDVWREASELAVAMLRQRQDSPSVVEETVLRELPSPATLLYTHFVEGIHAAVMSAGHQHLGATPTAEPYEGPSEHTAHGR